MSNMAQNLTTVIVRKPFAGHRPYDRIDIPAAAVDALIRVGRVSLVPIRKAPTGPVWTARRVEAGPSVVRQVRPESAPQPPLVTVDPLGRGWFVVSVGGVQETKDDGTVRRRREAEANERAAVIIQDLML